MEPTPFRSFIYLGEELDYIHLFRLLISSLTVGIHIFAWEKLNREDMNNQIVNESIFIY